MATKNPNIARTIRQQLGNMTLAMMGAHTIADHGNGLGFKFKGSRKANYMAILIDAGTDTYSVKFQKLGGRRTGYAAKVVGEFDMVHVGDLHGLIENTTGLYTRI